MEQGKMSEDILTSAAAFVEGGIQDACDDACSICLEEFSDSDPSTVTGCKHEFHLQCILEWCQRSSQCPMCWQPLSLKDTNSQELLDAVEHERNIRMNPPRNTTIFHHPTLGDFELQHLPASATDSELEERIIQHLAAAAAMGRTRHLARREGPRGSNAAVNQLGTSSNSRTPPPQSSPNNQDRAGPSDFQSFSESIKSRLSAMSMRYKESLTKSSRGWKEKFFSRNSSTPDHCAESRSEVSAAVATVSNLMEHLETTDSRASSAESNIPEDTLPVGLAEQHIPEIGDTHSLNEDNRQTPCAASSGSN
ncbi:E3 ubiquitin-protein ligase RHF2A-like isoform X3 [Lycium ferocissimum]|uniref:E3 ubiquitin-protein ligase RHF2A-like isoform X3 n=1 Tax=Lycium ferocissimum TaxID=112874 RepID=UPI002815B5DC|nr:E3 ubiquitin-protein ligase RHF2A-like isoform X3 [Lycium ferocissimum]